MIIATIKHINSGEKKNESWYINCEIPFNDEGSQFLSKLTKFKMVLFPVLLKLKKLRLLLPHERIVIETEEEIKLGLPDIVDANDIEYRDEADRKGFKRFLKFFDEYEYRKPIKDHGLKHQWWNIYGNYSAAERKLIIKLDMLIAFYFFIGYWVKFLDSANLTSAYVSGMKEDLGMEGNDFVNTQVVMKVGTVIFLLPFTYILPRYPPIVILFIGEMIWSTFTLATAGVQNLETLKAFRFMVGAAETFYFPIVHYTLTSWYLPHEVSKRGGFFYAGQFVGVLTASLIQGSVFDSLNGIKGLAGWRWAMIIDGIISFGSCALMLAMIPGTPFHCNSFFLTDDEIKLARKRMRKNGSDDGENLKNFFDKGTWIKMFKSWHFYVFMLGNVGGYNGSNADSGAYSLWLKSLDRYSIGKLNKLGAIPPAIGIAYVLLATSAADIFKTRFLMIVFTNSWSIVSNVILSIWDVPERAKWFAFYLSFWGWVQSPIFYPLHNDILRHDANLRSIEWNVAFLFGTQSYAWISKLIWPTVDAPRYKTGFTATAIFSSFMLMCMIVGLIFYKRDERKRAAENGIILYNSAKGDVVPQNIISPSETDSENVSSEEKKGGVEVKTNDIDRYDSL